MEVAFIKAFIKENSLDSEGTIFVVLVLIDGVEDTDRSFGTIIALIHSEASEALEEWRKGKTYEEVYYRESDGKPEGILFELADCIRSISVQSSICTL